MKKINKKETVKQVKNENYFCKSKKECKGKTIGLIMLFIGIVFLVQNTGIFSEWFNVGRLWPIIVIIIGLRLIYKK